MEPGLTRWMFCRGRGLVCGCVPLSCNSTHQIADRLLPNHRSLPAPFSQEECQELLSLLRSFPDQGEAIQAVVQNRIIARVLLRVGRFHLFRYRLTPLIRYFLAHWRQAHFRSTKPLPDDVGSGPIQPPKRPRSIGRVFIDFIVSCVCLGIPYIFFQRNNYHRLDEESGFRQCAPLFCIGACTCLVVSLLSSSVCCPSALRSFFPISLVASRLRLC